MNSMESRLQMLPLASKKTRSGRKLLTSVCYAAAYISLCAASTALGKDNQQLPGKEPVIYEKYSCKLVLPGEEWRWHEPPDFERGRGFIVLDGMANVVLKIQPAEDDKLTDIFARNFEGGVLRATGGKKIGSRTITYKGRPCYEFAVLMSGSPNVETTTRLLVERGYAYGITISMPSRATRLVSASDILEKCFDFTEIAEPEKSIAADSDSEMKPANSGGGWLLWGGLAVLVMGAGLVALLILKRKKM